MEISEKLDNSNPQFNFEWKPLLYKNREIPLWGLPIKRTGADEPVIYRHVTSYKMSNSEIVFTLYVGEGGSLNGPYKYNLCHQYKGHHGNSRKVVRNYIQQKKLRVWTERLIINDLNIDLSDMDTRKMIEKLLIGSYYLEYMELKAKNSGMLEFLNK